MSKDISFYDWEQRLGGIKTHKVMIAPKKKQVNSLGISDSRFKTFLAEWKEKNL